MQNSDLIAGDIYIVKNDDNTFDEYIIDNNKNKILITSKNASEIYLDTSKYNDDLAENTLDKASNKIHNEIFCWSGDREGKARFCKLDNFVYKKLETKNRNTLYFTTPCITFSIDLNNINGNSFKLPFSSTLSYDCLVKWGDGTEEKITSHNAIHTYSDKKIYEITISGDCPEINFYKNYSDDEKTNQKYQEALNEVFLLDILKQTDCDYMFAGCSNLISCECMPKRALNCSHMFEGCKKMNSNLTIKNLRFQGYKEYIIDNFKDTIYNKSKIYGKWTEDIYEQYPNNFEDKPMIELNDILKDARYSLVYSQIPNFVTVKPWEMIANGIIPFIHPDYDPEHILGLPEYVYIKNPDDLKNKIIELDNDDKLYLNILNKCLDCITKEDRDGTYINNFIMTNIANDLGFTYEPKKDITIKFTNHNYNNMHI